MEGGKDQVTSLHSRHGQTYGLQVTHLSHQYDVWVLPHGGPQGRSETVGVGTQFPLVNQTVLGFIREFYRVLNGYDVKPLPLVEVFYHGSQGGRLPTARGKSTTLASMIIPQPTG